MSENQDDKSAPESTDGGINKLDQKIESSNTNSIGTSPRRAELVSLATLATYAVNTNSLEVTRPTVTNCPDGGHDIGVTGKTEEVVNLIATLTGRTPDSLRFLDESTDTGKLKVRIDVKNGKTISGDVIHKHAADSNRSPDCQVNLLLLTNPDVKITPEAKKFK